MLPIFQDNPFTNEYVDLRSKVEAMPKTYPIALMQMRLNPNITLSQLKTAVQIDELQGYNPVKNAKEVKVKEKRVSPFARAMTKEEVLAPPRSAALCEKAIALRNKPGLNSARKAISILQQRQATIDSEMEDPAFYSEDRIEYMKDETRRFVTMLTERT